MKSKKEDNITFNWAKEYIEEKAGYIVWKESKCDIFYSNDLASTPTLPIMFGDSTEAVQCVHGLKSLTCWTDNEAMNKAVFHVPTIIVAYNHFMNLVNRLDQLRSTNPTRRKEKRVEMTIFTLFLDLAINNAYALLPKISPNLSAEHSFCLFKREI